MGILIANRVIRFFVMADFVLMSAWGLIGPIFAIFIVGFIETANPAMVAGVSSGIYWVVKAVLQIPISRILDRKQGEKDDYYFLLFGMLITSLVPLGYSIASVPSHLYLLEGIHAIGMAMVIPSWSGIFTRHITGGQEATSWSLDSSAISFGAGIAGIVGGAVVGFIGFHSLFFLVSIFSLISTFFFWCLRHDVFPSAAPRILPKIEPKFPH